MDILSFGDGHDPANVSSVILERRKPGRTNLLLSEGNMMWISWSQLGCDFQSTASLTYFFNESQVASVLNNLSPSELLRSPFVEPYVPKGYGALFQISVYASEGKYKYFHIFVDFFHFDHVIHNLRIYQNVLLTGATRDSCRSYQHRNTVEHHR